MMSYRKRQCRCGMWVTTNALGKAAHLRGEQHSEGIRQREQRLAPRRFWEVKRRAQPPLPDSIEPGSFIHVRDVRATDATSAVRLAYPDAREVRPVCEDGAGAWFEFTAELPFGPVGVRAYRVWEPT